MAMFSPTKAKLDKVRFLARTGWLDGDHGSKNRSKTADDLRCFSMKVGHCGAVVGPDGLMGGWAFGHAFWKAQGDMFEWDADKVKDLGKAVLTAIILNLFIAFSTVRLSIRAAFWTMRILKGIVETAVRVLSLGALVSIMKAPEFSLQLIIRIGINVGGILWCIWVMSVWVFTLALNKAIRVLIFEDKMNNGKYHNPKMASEGEEVMNGDFYGSRVEPEATSLLEMCHQPVFSSENDEIAKLQTEDVDVKLEDVQVEQAQNLSGQELLTIFFVGGVLWNAGMMCFPDPDAIADMLNKTP